MNANKELLNTIREAVSFANRKLPKSYSCIHNALSALDQLEAQQRGGFGVDEVMEVVLTWHNYSDLTEEQAQELCGNETPEEAYEDLRARLTAKAQGK